MDKYGYFRVGYSGLVEQLLCPNQFSYTSNKDYTIQTKHGLDIAKYIRPCDKTPTSSSPTKSYRELSFHEDIIEVLHPSSSEEITAQFKQQAESQFYVERSNDRIRGMNIPMTVVDVYPFFTGEKIIFNFISEEKKIDFRELARKMGQTFKVKIELHKIYPRDFAALLDGLGFCGRQFCCSSCHLHKKRSSSTEASTSGLLGVCGKPRCCLNLES